MAANSSVSGSAAQRKPYEGDAPIVMVPRAWTRPTSTSLPWQIAAYNKTQEQAQLSDAQKQAGLRLLAEAGAWMRETFAPRPEPTDLPGRIGRFLDDWWTDDFAGTVPVLGPAASAVGTGLDKFVEATKPMYDAIAQGATYGISALPGGEQPLTWDQAAKISPGQMALVNTWGKNSYMGQLMKASFDFAVEHNIHGETDAARKAADEKIEQFFPWLKDDFDITDEDAAERINNSLFGTVYSGTADALSVWFLDPLVLGGKAAKIARFGSRVLNIEPVTRQYTSRAATLRRIGEDLSLIHI